MPSEGHFDIMKGENGFLTFYKESCVVRRLWAPIECNHLYVDVYPHFMQGKYEDLSGSPKFVEYFEIYRSKQFLKLLLIQC